MLQPSKEESIRLALLQSDRHAEKKKWKPAIDALDQVLNKGVIHDKLLMKKGLLLGNMHQFKEAKTILQGLIDKKGGRKLTSDATRALKTVNTLQRKITESERLFLKQLHDLTNNNHHKPTHLPGPKQFKSGLDLSTAVRKEASLARTEKRYSLSLQLLNSALEHGLKSDWLLYEKSLTLKSIGQFEAAEIILRDLAKSKGKERLAQTVKKTLQNLESDRKQFASRKADHVLSHFKSIATDQSWSLCHLPQAPGKGGDKEMQKLGNEEAKAALNANQPQLCIEFIEAMLMYYPNNQQSQIIKAMAEIKLGRDKQAIEILKQMVPGDGKFALKARALLGEIWLKTALLTDVKKSPEKAIDFFISQHLKTSIIPEYTPQLDDVLTQLNPSKELHPDPELRRNQLKLRFNGKLIELLQVRLLQQKPDGEPQTQRKKAPSARLMPS